MRCFLLAAIALCGPWNVHATTLYRWVDRNGVVHWSDRPAPGSVEVASGTAQSYGSLGAPHPSSAQSRTSTPKPVPLYTGVDITSPAAESVLYSDGGRVECAAQLTPSLAPGHSIWFEIDGARMDSHGSMTITVPAPRGRHVVRVIILNAEGQEQIASAPVTFYVHQASIVTPPVGPSLKKPR
jgi:hypothetical protein